MEKIQLEVKLLGAGGKLPVCANPGEDLAYDIFAAQGRMLYPGTVIKVPTHIAAHLPGHGFLIRDRSSMAEKKVFVIGGVIDSTYRGEIIVMFAMLGTEPHYIGRGNKIAQLIPVEPKTRFSVVLVEELDMAGRGEKGFGSTGV